MTLRNRGEPTGFFRIAAPLLEAAMRRANGRDPARLRNVPRARPYAAISPCGLSTYFLAAPLSKSL
jgi:hypothetical protein